MIQAILFDMDGVLIDAKDWHYEALNRALDLFGMAIERNAHLATFDGLPTRQKLETLSRTRGLPRGLHDFINAMKQRFTIEMVHARCRPVFHHRHALSRLKQSGYKLGVCSNSIGSTVNLMMNLAGLAPLLDIQISTDDVTRAKPDPEMYLTAMKQLKVSPAATLILEDNEHGIKAALASGAHVMRVGSVDDVRYANIAAFIASLTPSTQRKAKG